MRCISRLAERDMFHPSLDRLSWAMLPVCSCTPVSSFKEGIAMGSMLKQEAKEQRSLHDFSEPGLENMLTDTAE